MPDNNKEREDQLKNYIENTEKTPIQAENPNVQHFGDNVRMKVDKIDADSTWMEIPLKELPFGKFYKPGTHIFVRPAATKEIESFAVVNEKNPYDVQLKLNEMLSACAKIVFPDGAVGTYRDLQNGDRETLAIVISRASAKNGRKLQKLAYCDCAASNKEGINVELLPANYVYKTEDADIAEYFDEEKRVYVFELHNGAIVELAPPTIGLTEDINNYIFLQTTKSGGKTTPNITFMQTIPYIKAGKGVKKMTIEQVEQEEFNFGKLNEELFMFIYDTIDKMSFGVEKLKGHCPKCSQEVYTSFGFPNGARALFIVPNAFKQFIRQRV